MELGKRLEIKNDSFIAEYLNKEFISWRSGNLELLITFLKKTAVPMYNVNDMKRLLDHVSIKGIHLLFDFLFTLTRNLSTTTLQNLFFARRFATRILNDDRGFQA